MAFFASPFPQTCASLKIHKRTPVNQQLRTGNIPTQLLTRQKHRGARQIACLARAAQRDAALHILALLGIREVLVVELRADGSRQQRIAANPVLAQRHRGALHETQDAGLGRRVVRLPTAADQRRDGRDADDGAAGRGLRGGHLARGGLHDVEGAVEVRAHRLGVQVGGQVQELGKGADARVADAHVQAAGAEGGQGEGDERGAGRRVRDVAGEVREGAGGAAGGAAGFEGGGFGGEGVEVRLVFGEAEVVDRDVAPLSEELEADGSADACGVC